MVSIRLTFYPAVLIAGIVCLFSNNILFAQAQTSSNVTLPVSNYCFSLEQNYNSALNVRGSVTSIVLHSPLNSATTKTISVVNQNTPSVLENLILARPNNNGLCANTGWQWLTWPYYSDQKRFPAGTPTAYGYPSNVFYKVIVYNLLPSNTSEDPLAWQWQMYEGPLPPYPLNPNTVASEEDTMINYIYTYHYLPFIFGDVYAGSQNAQTNLPMTNCTFLSAGTGSSPKKIAFLRTSQSMLNATLNNYLWNADTLRSQIGHAEYSYYLDLFKYDGSAGNTGSSNPAQGSCGTVNYLIDVSLPTPQLGAITQSSVQTGNAVAISGSGFAATGNVIMLTDTTLNSVYYVQNISSTDGKNLSVTIPDSVPVGSYNISVKGPYTWWSNSENIEVIAPPPILPPPPVVSNYTLSVSRIDSGYGTITSNPVGINCHPFTTAVSAPPDVCSATFKAGTLVTLTESTTVDPSLYIIPAKNITFEGWSSTPGGLCTGQQSTCTLSMNADSSVSGIFEHTTIVAIARLGPGSVDRYFNFFDTFSPDTVNISYGLSTFASSLARLQQAVNTQLALGNKVLVVGHSMGAFVAYALHGLYAADGGNVQFLYVDPPYNFILTKSCLSLLGGSFAAVHKAVCDGIASDRNTVSWTRGNSIGFLFKTYKNHVAFDYPNLARIAPNGKTNSQNLADLSAIVKDRLNSQCTLSCSFSTLPTLPTLGFSPIIHRVVSSSGRAGTIVPGDMVNISGSGFSPIGNNVEITNVKDSTVHYQLYDLVPDANGQLSFVLPGGPDDQDITSPIPTTAGSYALKVSAANSEWSATYPVTLSVSVQSVGSTPTGNIQKGFGSLVLNQEADSSCPGTVFSSDLNVGADGANVSQLQAWLISNGYDIPGISSDALVSGHYGEQTANALSKYQSDAGISPTGYFGPLSRARINAICRQPIDSISLPPTIATPSPKPTPTSNIIPDGTPSPTNGQSFSPSVSPAQQVLPVPTVSLSPSPSPSPSHSSSPSPSFSSSPSPSMVANPSPSPSVTPGSSLSPTPLVSPTISPPTSINNGQGSGLLGNIFIAFKNLLFF